MISNHKIYNTPTRPQWFRPFHAVLLLAITVVLSGCGRTEFNEREKNILANLSLSKLKPPVPESNQYAFNEKAQLLGEQLFNDTRLSGNGEFSCASCHQPDKHFTDGLPKGEAIGLTDRNTPALHGSAWQSWFYWDGRRDSLWAQALTPIEAPKEMSNHRVAITLLIATDQDYREKYEALFGPVPYLSGDPQLSVSATPMGDQIQKRTWIELPTDTQVKINTVFSNVGKALGAYQHTLAPVETRFDLFQQEVASGKTIKEIDTLDKQELKGALLFLNEKKTQCLECHNGPLLSNGNFHNIATGNFTGPVFDFGREFGAQAALLDEFNCQGRYSDAKTEECLHLIYMNRDSVHMRGAFKTPTLRNITNTAPYFHDGRFTTLEQVVRYYANPPIMDRPDAHELRPGFELTEKEIKSLTAFLQSFEPAPSR